MKTLQALIRAAGFAVLVAAGTALVVHADKPSATSINAFSMKK